MTSGSSPAPIGLPAVPVAVKKGVTAFNGVSAT